MTSSKPLWLKQRLLAYIVSSYRLSDRARGELQQVIFQSIDYFGVNQAIRYREQLRHRFQLLAENPRLGRLAPRAGKNVRRHEHAAHVIFYRESDDGILILGVVHSRRMRSLRF